jgi:hypothetical protein
MKIIRNIRHKALLILTSIFLVITTIAVFPSKEARADDCSWFDVGCHLEQVLKGKIDEAIASVIESTTTFWMSVKFQGIAGKGASAGAQVATDLSGFNQYIGYGKWIAAAVAIAALMVFFVGMAKSKHEGNIMDRLGSLFWIIVGLLVASSAIGLGSAILTTTSIPVGNMLEWTINMYYPLAMGCAAISLIITGIRTILDQNGKPIKKFIEKFLLVLLIANLGPALLLTLGNMFDNFSDSLIQSAFADAAHNLGQTFSEDRIGDVIGHTIGTALSSASQNLALSLVYLIVAAIVSLVLCIIMVIRSIMLIMLAGFLVLYAAVYDTNMGKKGFESLWTWIIALLLFKPAAATVYAVGLKFLTSGDFNGAMYWMGSTVMAIFALPALVKIIAPTTAAVVGGGSGATALGGAAMFAGHLGGGSGAGTPTGNDGAAAGGGASGAAASAGPIGMAAAAGMTAANAMKGAVNEGVTGESDSSSSSSSGSPTGSVSAAGSSKGAGPSGGASAAGPVGAGVAAGAAVVGGVAGGVQSAVGEAGGDSQAASSGASAVGQSAASGAKMANASRGGGSNNTPKPHSIKSADGPTGNASIH